MKYKMKYKFLIYFFNKVSTIKVGLLQPGLFIFGRWENFSIVQLIVCWSDVDLGGLGVTCSPQDPRFAGSNPTEVLQEGL